MVDWSGGGDTGPRPRKDAIWAAVWRAGRLEPATYLRNRAVALDWLAALVSAERVAGRRLLVGFDFPFGYPAGFAARVTGSADPLALWDWLASALEALPAGEGRFDLAARLNRRFPGSGRSGSTGCAATFPTCPGKGAGWAAMACRCAARPRRRHLARSACGRWAGPARSDPRR